jgi:hypothetical protein
VCISLNLAQNIWEPLPRHRNEGKRKLKGQGGSMTHYALPLPHPSRTSAGQPQTRVFVMVNKALRYLATGLPKSFQLFKHECYARIGILAQRLKAVQNGPVGWIWCCVIRLLRALKADLLVLQWFFILSFIPLFYKSYVLNDHFLLFEQSCIFKNTASNTHNGNWNL